MERTTVLLLFGGESSEHAISISSAQNVYAALDDRKYDVILCYIDESGAWYLLDDFAEQIDTGLAPRLVPVPGSGTFMTIPGSEIYTPNVIFPVLHGSNGEDGTVQGLAKLTHIPIVGCGVTSSAICIDKVVTKQLLEYAGIKTVPFVVHLSGEPLPSYDKLANLLGSPLFVKPARSGSSVGVSKVRNDSELSDALSDAHQHDTKVLLEKAIAARELEVGVLGTERKPQVSGVGEIIPDREFYDYSSKYDNSSQTKAVIPADIAQEISNEIKSIAMKVYDVLGCDGLARIDYFFSDDNIIYVNEVNTLPGFTNISMYPKLWHQEGFSYSGLIDTLIKIALEK